MTNGNHLNEDKFSEAEGTATTAASSEEANRIFRVIYCSRHSEHINGVSGCRCTIESGCAGLDTDPDRVQEQSSDSNLQRLRASTDAREIRACVDY